MTHSYILYRRVNNSPYRDRGPTANLSEEVLKMQYTIRFVTFLTQTVSELRSTSVSGTSDHTCTFEHIYRL